MFSIVACMVCFISFAVDGSNGKGRGAGYSLTEIRFRCTSRQTGRLGPLRATAYGALQCFVHDNGQERREFLVQQGPTKCYKAGREVG